MKIAGKSDDRKVEAEEGIEEGVDKGVEEDVVVERRPIQPGLAVLGGRLLVCPQCRVRPSPAPCLFLFLFLFFFIWLRRKCLNTEGIRHGRVAQMSRHDLIRSVPLLHIVVFWMCRPKSPLSTASKNLGSSIFVYDPDIVSN